MMPKSLSLIGVILLLASCGNQPMYESYQRVSAEQWHQDSAVTFDVDITDTLAAYQVVWYLRNTDDYPFKNIYLFREVTSKRGKEFGDTAEFFLADDYGKWLGKGVGELKTNTWPFKQGYLRFNHAGTYTFTFQQAMRTTNLLGVKDIGLGIFKLKEEE